MSDQEQIEAVAMSMWHADVTRIWPHVKLSSWGEDSGAKEFYMAKAARELKEAEAE